MADPKVFTGPEGYSFTLYEGDARPGVIVASRGAPLDKGTWIPLAELLAFMAWRDCAEIEEPDAPAPPKVHTAGGCDHNMIAVHTDGSEMCRLCRANRVSRQHPWRITVPLAQRAFEAGSPRCGLCKDTGRRRSAAGGFTRCDCEARR